MYIEQLMPIIWVNFEVTNAQTKFLPLHLWVASSCCNTTLIGFVSDHVDVAFVTPASTPAAHPQQCTNY